MPFRSFQSLSLGQIMTFTIYLSFKLFFTVCNKYTLELANNKRHNMAHIVCSIQYAAYYLLHIKCSKFCVLGISSVNEPAIKSGR